jgi:DNA-binding response OmpR family regulator
MMPVVLICESDSLQAQYLQQLYTQAGFVVQVFSSYLQLKRVAAQTPELPQAILLNLVPPLEKTFDRCQQLHHTLPFASVLLLSHYQDHAYCQAAFDAGADDYLLMPFQPQELIARTRAHLLRTHTIVNATLQGKPAEAAILSFGHIELWPALRQVCWDGNRVKLTETEFKLLHFLCRHANHEVTRAQLYQWVWQAKAPEGSRRLDNFVLGLRKKLPPSPLLELVTCYGGGYRLRLG